MSLIQQGKASDTDASLTNPGVREADALGVVYCNASTLAAPTAQMLASCNTVFALDGRHPFALSQQMERTSCLKRSYTDASGNITGWWGGKLPLFNARNGSNAGNHQRIAVDSTTPRNDQAKTGLTLSIGQHCYVYNGLPTQVNPTIQPFTIRRTYRAGTSGSVHSYRTTGRNRLLYCSFIQH